MNDHGIDRRAALTAMGAAGLGTLGLASAQPNELLRPRRRDTATVPTLTPEMLGFDPKSGRYALPPLPYAKDALEPHIDAKTMEIHHERHHQGYVNGLNKALDELQKIREGSGDAGLMKHWSRELSFNGGGHLNHTLFWLNMAPAGKGGGGMPQGKLAEQMGKDFGSFDQFTAHFKAAAGSVEASGWAWLVYEPFAQRLMVVQMEKQQDMLVNNAQPLLGIDVWEHAYYLKYQNRRADYVSAFMNIINWSFVQRRFEEMAG